MSHLASFSLVTLSEVSPLVPPPDLKELPDPSIKTQVNMALDRDLEAKRAGLTLPKEEAEEGVSVTRYENEQGLLVERTTANGKVRSERLVGPSEASAK